MKTAPRLLSSGTMLLPRQLFADLQIEKILSAHAISVLQNPCEKQEIARRQELFVLLESDAVLEKVKRCLSALVETERAIGLWKDAKTAIDRYHLQANVISAYIGACESLSSLSGSGSLLSDVADYYSSADRQALLDVLREDHQKIKTLLRKTYVSLLSMSDKDWLTPDYNAVSEFDQIAACAQKLGLTTSKKKVLNTKIDGSLSDAICGLYAAEVAEIEVLFAKYAGVDFYEPLVYIPEIKFFLEIYDFIQRAQMSGVPNCIPHIADNPHYTARELYDSTLLAKNCQQIIPSDVEFTEQEPFFFLTGANGGGKTTYLRAVGSNLVLFLAGCPVFAKEATIYPFDSVASHFPKDERFDHIGRLVEELKRTTDMLSASDGKKAFLLFNETYSGTDDKRGFELLKSTSDQISKASYFCLYVTHFHEVMRTDYPVLSAEIDPADENKRTYRIIKSKGNASSYAIDILKKYRLDQDSLRKRRACNGN